MMSYDKRENSFFVVFVGSEESSLHPKRVIETYAACARSAQQSYPKIPLAWTQFIESDIITE